MTRLHRTITVSRPIDEVFDLVADFSTSRQWDPGVVAASILDGGEPGPGAEYQLVVVFGGRRIPMRYRTTAYDRPNRVTLVGRGAAVTTIDTIRLQARNGAGTQVDYLAELALKGPLQLAQPLLKGAFDRMADRALEGLSEFLA